MRCGYFPFVSLYRLYSLQISGVNMNEKKWPGEYLPKDAEVIFSARLPSLSPSTNHTYSCTRGGIYYKKTEVKDWQAAVSCIFANLYGKPVPCEKEVGFYIYLKTKNKRRLDADNRIKSVQDCLKMAGVLKDDSQIWDLRVIRDVDRSLKEDECEVVVFI